VRRKITSPDVVELKTAGKVIAGLVANEPFFRQPREQKRLAARLQLYTIGGHGVVYVRWLVQGAGDVQVAVHSVKGGSHALAAGAAHR
jgi:hypothetical protein